MKEPIDKAVTDELRKQTIKMQCDIAGELVEQFHRAAATGDAEDVAVCMIAWEIMSAQLFVMLEPSMSHKVWKGCVEFSCQNFQKTTIETYKVRNSKSLKPRLDRRS